MEKIIQLSRLFLDYEIYPKPLFTNETPVKVFQKLYPQNHYSGEVEALLKLHDYNSVRRGSDLPWWGSKYFSEDQGSRVLIISQDSLSSDAGSIVFFANLFPVCNDREDYDWYCKRLSSNQSFRFSSWEKIKELLEQWALDLDFLYITDATKVYKMGSWKDRDFDKIRSKKLLEKEITFCKPDLLIILGNAGLSLLLPDVKYGNIVDKGMPISLLGIKTIVSPFPIGNGPAQPNFEKRLQLATNRILSLSNHKPKW